MSDDGTAEMKSRYQELTQPVFTSTIPPYLLGKISESEKHIVESLSRIEQQNAWLVDAAVRSSRAIVEIDVRQTKQEVWKNMLTSRWSMVAGIVLLILPTFGKAIWDHLFGRK